jgi:hypothetical protein
MVDSGCLRCEDGRAVALALAGTYTLTVNGGVSKDGATGTYIFQIRNP